MKNTLLLVLAITTLKISAQNNYVGIEGGPVYSNIYHSYYYPNSSSMLRASCGFTYTFIVANRFESSAGLLYTQKAFVLQEYGPGAYGTDIYSHRYSYLSVPLKEGFRFGDKTYGFINIGVVLSCLVSATAEEQYENRIYKTDIKNWSPSWDVSGLVELGIGQQIKERLRLNTSLAFQHSFTPTQNGSDTHFYGIALSVGLKYALKKG